MEHEALTYRINQCVFTVYKKLGTGFLESVYEKALLIELRKSGLAATTQVPIEIKYDGESVGNFFADILVENKIILELKAVSALLPVHEAQLVNYLVATGKDIGLLINFGETKAEVRRKYRLRKTTPPVN